MTLTRDAGRPHSRLAVSRKTAMGWGLIAPALLVLVAMAVAPAIYLVYVSFRHENLLGPGSAFVGLQNFSQRSHEPGDLVRRAFDD